MDNLDFDYDDEFLDRRGNTLVELAFDEIKHETDKAWLLLFYPKKAEEINGGVMPQEFWFPKSQCDLDATNKRIWVPQWLVEEKGVEEYAV